MQNYFSFHTLNNDDWVDEKYYNHVFSHFSALEGMIMSYYGADTSSHEFKLDDIIFRVLEDPNDGYRSCLGVIEYGDQSNAIFFKRPLASVRVVEFDEENSELYNRFEHNVRAQGYRLVDVTDGHVWVEFCTSNYDDYYPCFIFRHNPKLI